MQLKKNIKLGIINLLIYLILLVNTSYVFAQEDSSIKNTDKIIKEIKVTDTYKPNTNKIDLLLKRYDIWKDLYKTNSPIADKLNL